MSATLTQTDTGASKAIRSPLPDDQRKLVAEELQATLIELLDLTLQAKQAHWTVVGPRFRPLHLQLDEMVEAYRAWTDRVAERMSAVGIWPDGRVRTVTEGTPFAEVPEGAIEDDEVVRLFVERVGEAAGRVRRRVERLEVDLVSQEVLLEVLSGLEEQLWMLQAQQA